MARALIEMEKPELAVAWARQSTELGPDHARTHVLLGDALRASGDQAGAAKAWRKAAEVDPDDAEARYRVGKLLSDSD